MNNEDHVSCPQRAICAGLRSVFHKRPGIDESALLPHAANPKTDAMFSSVTAMGHGVSPSPEAP